MGPVQNNGKAQLEQALSEGEQKLSDSADQLNAMENRLTPTAWLSWTQAGRSMSRIWPCGRAVLTRSWQIRQNMTAIMPPIRPDSINISRPEHNIDAVKDFLPPEQAAAMEAQLEQTRQQLDASSQALADAKTQLDEAKAQLNARKNTSWTLRRMS